MVAQVGCGLGHASGVARGADAATFAGEGHQKIVTAVVATHPCKAVGEDAAFEVFAESFLYVGAWRVVIALAFELSGTCQLKPGLEVLGHRAVQQSALGMAGVVGFGELGGCSSLRGLSRLGAQRGMLVPTRVLVKMLL